MSHEPGTTIGSYTIEREIGRGGMGVVLLATDSRLHRQVALKALPPDLAGDPDRLGRFEREARVLASLSHPNIAGIHAVEHDAEDRRYLVLEYVSGPTLAEMILRGALPVDEALHIASQIAAGVAAAHDAGIVHRDLKPGNIKIAPEGQVKVLDFGIAKALAPEMPATMTASPTLTIPQTQPGAVIGTAPYLSPEQARGKPVDKRTDVWAFACVVYEMLTAQRAFPGETAADVLGAIIERDPNWEALPANTPHRVRDLLARCLAKDRNKRLRDIGDARIELELARDNREWSTTSLAGVPAGRSKRRVPWGTVALLAVAGGVVLAQWLGGGGGAPERASVRPAWFSIDPVEGLVASNERRVVTSRPRIAPDGSAIAFIADLGAGEMIYVRRLDEVVARAIPGTKGGGRPSFSPDGQWLAYTSAEGDLMKTPLGGGPSQTLVPLAWSVGSEVVWLEDGTLVFPMSFGAELGRVSERGGEIETIVRTEPDAGIKGIERVAAIPGGRGILFSAFDGATIESFSIYVLEAGSTTPRRIMEKASHPRVLGSGCLTFFRDDTLLAARFDLERLEVVGAPAPVVTGVETDVWGGTANYDVSFDGILVYTPGRRRGAERHLAFIDPATGAVERISPKSDFYFDCLSVSPDGRHLTVATMRRRYELWIYDLQRHSMTSVGVPGEFHAAVWSPGGREVVLAGFDPEVSYEKTVAFALDLDSGLSARPVEIDVERTWWPGALTSDGRMLLNEADPRNDFSRALRWDRSSGEVEPLFESDAYVYNLALSPDEKWLAYSQYRKADVGEHVFVRRYPIDGRAWQLSFDDMDDTAHWSPDGKTLYFANEQTMYAVDIETEPSFRASPARAVFDWPFSESEPSWQDVSMHPSGKFVVIERAPWECKPTRFNVVMGFEEVVRRALEDGAPR